MGLGATRFNPPTPYDPQRFRRRQPSVQLLVKILHELRR